MPPRDLVENEYFRIIADDAARLVRLVRSVAPFPSIEAIEEAFTAVEGALSAISHDWALLIDSRDGPLRNDAAFEDRLARARQITGQFSRVAVLVRSAVGRLQVARYAREDRRPPGVFHDEAEALAFLTSPLSIKGSGR